MRKLGPVQHGDRHVNAFVFSPSDGLVWRKSTPSYLDLAREDALEGCDVVGTVRVVEQRDVHLV